MGTEELDLAHAAQGLLDHAGEVAGGFLHLLVGAAQLAAGHPDQPGHDGGDGDDDQGQLPGGVDEVAGEADDDQGVAHHDDPGVGQGRAHLGDVVEDARQHASAGLGLVHRDGQVHLVAEDLLTQVGDGLVGDPLAGHVGGVLGHALGQEGQHQEQGHLPLGHVVLLDQALVHQRLEQGRQHRLQRRRGDHGQHRQGHHLAVGADGAEQAAVKQEGALHSRCRTLSTIRLAQPSARKRLCISRRLYSVFTHSRKPMGD
jgi:hypothetical protein